MTVNVDRSQVEDLVAVRDGQKMYLNMTTRDKLHSSYTCKIQLFGQQLDAHIDRFMPNKPVQAYFKFAKAELAWHESF